MNTTTIERPILSRADRKALNKAAYAAVCAARVPGERLDRESLRIRWEQQRAAMRGGSAMVAAVSAPPVICLPGPAPMSVAVAPSPDIQPAAREWFRLIGRDLPFRVAGFHEAAGFIASVRGVTADGTQETVARVADVEWLAAPPAAPVSAAKPVKATASSKVGKVVAGGVHPGVRAATALAAAVRSAYAELGGQWAMGASVWTGRPSMVRKMSADRRLLFLFPGAMRLPAPRHWPDGKIDPFFVDVMPPAPVDCSPSDAWARQENYRRADVAKLADMDAYANFLADQIALDHALNAVRNARHGRKTARMDADSIRFMRLSDAPNLARIDEYRRKRATMLGTAWKAWRAHWPVALRLSPELAVWGA